MDDSGPLRRVRTLGAPRIEDLVRRGEHYLALGFQISKRDHATSAFQVAEHPNTRKAPDPRSREKRRPSDSSASTRRSLIARARSGLASFGTISTARSTSLTRSTSGFSILPNRTTATTLPRNPRPPVDVVHPARELR
jgi:hypothetical protein